MHSPLIIWPMDVVFKANSLTHFSSEGKGTLSPCGCSFGLVAYTRRPRWQLLKSNAVPRHSTWCRCNQTRPQWHLWRSVVGVLVKGEIHVVQYLLKVPLITLLVRCFNQQHVVSTTLKADCKIGAIAWALFPCKTVLLSISLWQSWKQNHDINFTLEIKI